MNSVTGEYEWNALGMIFNNENLPIFYPNIPTQNDRYNCGVYCLKYVKIMYEHSQWDFLDGTSSKIVGGLSAIMIFQNPEAISSLRILIKKGINLLASNKIHWNNQRRYNCVVVKIPYPMLVSDHSKKYVIKWFICNYVSGLYVTMLVTIAINDAI